MGHRDERFGLGTENPDGTAETSVSAVRTLQVLACLLGKQVLCSESRYLGGRGQSQGRGHSRGRGSQWLGDSGACVEAGSGLVLSWVSGRGRAAAFTRALWVPSFARVRRRDPR